MLEKKGAALYDRKRVDSASPVLTNNITSGTMDCSYLAGLAEQRKLNATEQSVDCPYLRWPLKLRNNGD